MATIVIGGQASGVGKTSVICALLAAMPELRWTAIKVTQCSHGEKRCDCELGGGAFAVSEECDRTADADTSRYLAAGAVRALWVRTLPGHLGEAIPRIEEEIASVENVMIESNSILEFVRPDVYAVVVSPGLADFKATARRYMDQADAILSAAPPDEEKTVGEWPEELMHRVSGAMRFAIDAERAAPPEFVAYVRTRMEHADLMRK